MRRRGHPVLGAIAGILLGLFVAVDLMLWKVTYLNSAALIAPPVAGLVVGVALGMWGPFGRRAKVSKGATD